MWWGADQGGQVSEVGHWIRVNGKARKGEGGALIRAGRAGGTVDAGWALVGRWAGRGGVVVVGLGGGLSGVAGGRLDAGLVALVDLQHRACARTRPEGLGRV